MVTCATCGRGNPPDARFCNGCGADLAAPAEEPHEERKVVSVVFVDLVGFTSRAERLDPEDVRALLAPYWHHLRNELERFGGTVEKFIGDAVMALFGAPVAHEDDAERAVRAALAIRDWVRESAEDLQVRIAVNSGEALVLLGARPGEGEGMAAGDVVNTAARLQTAAPVNGVLVGEATYRATRQAIGYAEHEPVEAKGKAEPLRAWEAVEARGRATVESMSRSALVGRGAELDLLLGAAQRARREREPQLVTVAGVPGIGKSRLVAELYAAIDADEDLVGWRRGRSLSYGEEVSLWALGEIVKSELGVLESDGAAETATKVQEALADLIEDDDERDWISLHLAPLAGLPAEEVDRAQSPAAWRRWLELLAERRPLVLVFEDLQWADDELLEFVEELTDWIAGVPLLVVCTARPELYERRPGWAGGKRNALAISLRPLEDADTARILASALDQALLPAEIQAVLLERAGGNPLYAEQYARMLAEGAQADALPDTVQGIVAARLDLLPPDEKSLLQDAAVMGRAFWPGAIGAGDEQLRGLVRKEFVRRERRSSIAGEAEYAFAHALVRDVAYGQIPRAARAQKHRRSAEWIASLPADRAADHAALLAHHYGAALDLAEAAGVDATDLRERARLAFREAGLRALSLNGVAAAERFLSAAIELWPAEDPELASLLLSRAKTRRAAGPIAGAVSDAEAALALVVHGPEREADALLVLATACWFAGRGVEAGEHGSRAAALVRDLPDSRVKAEVLVGQARLVMLAGGDPDTVVELADEGLRLSEVLDLEQLQAEALTTRGTVVRDMADLERAAQIAEQCKAIGTFQRAVNNRLYLDYTAGRLGDIDSGLASSREVSRRFGFANNLRWIDGTEVQHRLMFGSWDGALELADQLTAFDAAGDHDVLSANAFAVRAHIRHARALQGWREDADCATAYAREDGGQLLPVLLCMNACLLAFEGEGPAAARLVDEVEAFFATHPYAPLVWEPAVVFAFLALGRLDSYRALLEQSPDSPSLWIDAASAVLDGDFTAAAEVYGGMGARTAEAEARVHAARSLLERGDTAGSQAELTRAVAFYREVGAMALIREAETLLPATA